MFVDAGMGRRAACATPLLVCSRALASVRGPRYTLAAAIPAVIGYNQLTQKLRVIGNEAATFVSEFGDLALTAGLRGARLGPGERAHEPAFVERAGR